MLARGIRAAGFDVAIFNSAEEFLDSGSITRSVCLILDVDLPGITGIELQQRLNESGADIPVILISGNPDEQTGPRALGAGAAGFFNKPFSIDTLIATIQSIEQQPNAI
jgi:FixJ family two-component response regulator